MPGSRNSRHSDTRLPRPPRERLPVQGLLVPPPAVGYATVQWVKDYIDDILALITPGGPRIWDWSDEINSDHALLIWD